MKYFTFAYESLRGPFYSNIVTERSYKLKDLYFFISSRSISYAYVSFDLMEALSLMSPLKLIFSSQMPEIPGDGNFYVACLILDYYFFWLLIYSMVF